MPDVCCCQKDNYQKTEDRRNIDPLSSEILFSEAAFFSHNQGNSCNGNDNGDSCKG